MEKRMLEISKNNAIGIDYLDIPGHDGVKPKVITTYAADEDDISVKIVYRIHASGKQASYAHILEHCMFGNTYNGKDLSACIVDLGKMGIIVNASTGVATMTFDFRIAAAFKEVSKENQKGLLWETMWKHYDVEENKKEWRSNWKEFLTVIRNIMTYVPTEKDVEREKKIVYTESTRYIDESKVEHAIYDALLECENLGPTVLKNELNHILDCTHDDIMALRWVLNTNEIVGIAISAPYADDSSSIVEELIAELSDMILKPVYFKYKPEYKDTIDRATSVLEAKVARSSGIVNMTESDELPEKISAQFLHIYPEAGDVINSMCSNYKIATVGCAFAVLRDYLERFFRDKKEVSYGANSYVQRVEYIDDKHRLNARYLRYVGLDISPDLSYQEVMDLWKEFVEFVKLEEDNIYKDVLFNLKKRKYSIFSSILEGNQGYYTLTRAHNNDTYFSVLSLEEVEQHIRGKIIELQEYNDDVENDIRRELHHFLDTATPMLIVTD